MLVIALGVVACLTIIGWYLMHDVFSPFVIQPGIWFAIIALYYIVQPDYYPICHDLPWAVVLWCSGFAFAAYAMFYITPERRGFFSNNAPFLSGNLQPSRMLIKVYYILVVISIPLMLYMLVNKAVNRGESNILLYLRLSGIDDTLERPDFGVANYLVPLALVLLILAMMYIKSRKLKIIAIVLNIMAGMLTMAKTNFFVVLVAVLYILYIRKRVRMRTIAIWMLIFIAFSVGFQFLRGMGMAENDLFSPSEMLSLYTISPLVAFDYYADAFSSPHVGENVFRFYYAVTYSLGGDIPPASNIFSFVGVPDLTNTYTILYPFYTDFGLPGIAIFGIVYGAAYGFLYKRSLYGGAYYQALYACFLNYLVLQFVQENFFSNLSINIQYILFFILPFLAAYVKGNDKQPTNLPCRPQ